MVEGAHRACDRNHHPRRPRGALPPGGREHGIGRGARAAHGPEHGLVRGRVRIAPRLRPADAPQVEEGLLASYVTPTCPDACGVSLDVALPSKSTTSAPG